MFVLVHGDGTSSLMNPSPARTTPLPELAVCLRRHGPSVYFRRRRIFRQVPADEPFPWNMIFQKVVVSDSLIAALVHTKVIISTRGQRCDTTSCSTMEWRPARGFINDIALFKGKLYILTATSELYLQLELHILDGGQEQTARRIIPGVDSGKELSLYHPYSPKAYEQHNYLVVSGDRLLMVERRIYGSQMFPPDLGIEK
jgi:hypothetical protein